MSEELRGKWGLVTGASSGIGVDIARELARRGMNVLLVARRRDRMLALAEELTAAHGIEAEVLAFDLSDPASPPALHAAATADGRAVHVLVNNAGFGAFGNFWETAWERHASMLRLNMGSLSHLTWLFTRDMVERGAGRIMQVASIGAFQPSPSYAAYSATKSYVLSLGVAVNHELKGTGVTSTVVSPGATRTEFIDVSGQGHESLLFKLLAMTSEEVARVGVKAMLKGRASIVPGLMNTINTWFVRHMPMALATWIAGRSVQE